MEINKDTTLSEILDSCKVIEITATGLNNINNTISGRTAALTSEMTNGGLTQSVIINGQPVLNNAASEIVGKYYEVNSAVESTFSNINNLAVEKELEELAELRKCVQAEVDRLASEISMYKRYMNLDVTDEEKKAYQTAYNNFCNKKETYDEKLVAIDQRISSVSSMNISTELSGNANSKTESNDGKKSGNRNYVENAIPSFELDKDGRPTSPPLDFSVDSKHRLDLPGFGMCVEGTGGNVTVFHYDSGTNKFYYSSDPKVNWNTYNYKDDIYGITPEEMKNSAIKGGIIPF